MSRESDLEKVKRACADLGEHFDTVQIFTTRHEPTEGGTRNISWGSGNWFARYGQTKNWIVHEDERIREDLRKDTE